MITRWADAGLAWTVEVATTGALVVGGIPAAVPIVAGGTGGVPLGWTQYKTVPASNMTDANFTTSTPLGRFSVSNALGVATVGHRFGAYVDVPVTVGRSYRVGLLARVMEGKDASWRSVWVRGLASGVVQPSPLLFSERQAQTEWERISLLSNPIPAGITHLRIEIDASSMYYLPPVNWGTQFSDVFLADMTPDSAPIVWRDITCDVREITTRNGREQFTERYEVGTTHVELNNDLGDYSYRDPHPFGFRPGRQIRGTVTYDGDTFPMFYAVIDSIKDGYSLDGHAVSSISAFDPTSLFSGAKTPSITTPAMILSGERVEWLLRTLGYVARDIDAGQFVMQEILSSGRSIREEMGVTADSEGGSIYAERDGTIVYRDRTWRDTDPNVNTVTATVLARTDDANLDVGIDGIPTQTDAPIVCANELETDWTLARVINYVELANAGGTVEIYEDEASQSAHGIQTYSRTDFVNYIPSSNSLGYLATRAADLMNGYATPVLRVNSVSFRPNSEDDWRWALTVFLNWLVRIWYAHPLNDWGYALATHVQRIEHRITVDDWLITLAVDQPESFVDAPVVPQSHWDDGIARWDDGVSVWS